MTEPSKQLKKQRRTKMKDRKNKHTNYSIHNKRKQAPSQERHPRVTNSFNFVILVCIERRALPCVVQRRLKCKFYEPLAAQHTRSTASITFAYQHPLAFVIRLRPLCSQVCITCIARCMTWLQTAGCPDCLSFHPGRAEGCVHGPE